MTPSIQKGDNAIGVELGRGYFGMADVGGDDFNYPNAPWRDEPRLLAQLDITLANGTTQRVISDGSWKIADSPTHDNLYFGESYDARLAKAGWNKLTYDDSTWENAHEQAAPTESIAPATQPPVKVTQTLRPVKVTKLANGDKVYDFGRHTAGWTGSPPRQRRHRHQHDLRRTAQRRRHGLPVPEGPGPRPARGHLHAGRHRAAVPGSPASPATGSATSRSPPPLLSRPSPSRRASYTTP